MGRIVVIGWSTVGSPGPCRSAPPVFATERGRTIGRDTHEPLVTTGRTDRNER
ncbi:hypothetical protein J2S53_003919 [Actinopolyspora lacussalsi]|nr:hypothetical protein [Actinopolyspora lacussalsi]